MSAGNKDKVDWTAVADRSRMELHLHEAEEERDMLRDFISDAYAFIGYALDKGGTAGMIVSTLAHDIGGLHRREKCFQPRVHGYGKRVGGAVDQVIESMAGK